MRFFDAGGKEERKMETTKKSNVRAMVLSGIFIAVAFVLSYIRLFQMPQGGSVIFASILPILLIGLMFGPGWGIGSGVVFGVLQYFQGGYALTPFNIILDYVLAFGALGLTGFFKTGKYRFYVSGVVASALRLICHFLSGVIFYAAYAPEGQPVWLYSVIYNGPYLVVDLIIALIVGGVLIRAVPQLKNLGR